MTFPIAWGLSIAIPTLCIVQAVARTKKALFFDIRSRLCAYPDNDAAPSQREDLIPTTIQEQDARTGRTAVAKISMQPLRAKGSTHE